MAKHQREARGGGALMLAFVVLLSSAGGLVGCKKSRPMTTRIRVARGQVVHQLGSAVSTGARGPGALFAAGTPRGGVILVKADDAQPVRLLQDIDVRRRAKAKAGSGTGKGTGKGTSAGTSTSASTGKGKGKGAGKGSGTGTGAGSGTAQAKPKKPVPPEHDSGVTALSFSPDGSELLSVGGHRAILWDVKKQRMLYQVRGPLPLTAGVIGPSGKAAFFGTTHGHVLRWRPRKRSEGEGIDKFYCRPTLVQPERRKLVEEKRCLVGYYSYQAKRPLCLYPVTQMLRATKGRLIRGCREGSVGVLTLANRKIRWSSVAGALRALVLIDDDTMLFARADGELRTWSISQRKLGKPLLPGVRADAAAAAAGIVAVASGGVVRFWLAGTSQVAGAVKIPAPAVFMSLRAKPLALEVLLRDGRFVRHPLRREQVAAAALGKTK